MARDVTIPHRVGGGTIRVLGNAMPRQPLFRMATYLRNAVYACALPHVPLRWKLAQGLYLPLQATLYWADSGFRPAVLRRLAGALRDGLLGRLGPAGRYVLKRGCRERVARRGDRQLERRRPSCGHAWRVSPPITDAADVQVIVVDNASTDGSLEDLPPPAPPAPTDPQRREPRLRPRLRRGRPPPDLRARSCSSTPDTRVAPDALALARAALLADPRTGDRRRPADRRGG